MKILSYNISALAPVILWPLYSQTHYPPSALLPQLSNHRHEDFQSSALPILGELPLIENGSRNQLYFHWVVGLYN